MKRLFEIILAYIRSLMGRTNAPSYAELGTEATPTAPKAKDKRTPVSRKTFRQISRQRRKENIAWNRVNRHLPNRPQKRVEIERAMSKEFVIRKGLGGYRSPKASQKMVIRSWVDHNRRWNAEHPHAMVPTNPKKIRRDLRRHQS